MGSDMSRGSWGEHTAPTCTRDLVKEKKFDVSHLVVCVYFPYLLWAPNLSGKLTIT